MTATKVAIVGPGNIGTDLMIKIESRRREEVPLSGTRARPPWPSAAS
jgi:acetaldehyde dehydrogenase (acetylating)